MAANIICNDITLPPPPPPVAGFGSAQGAGCFITDGGPTTQISYVLQFNANGTLAEGSPTLGPLDPRGNWLIAGVPSDFEIMTSAPAADGLTPGVFYPMAGGRTVTWTYTLVASAGGRFLTGSVTLRRISDGAIMQVLNFENIQLGVNTECV